jgi:predicted dehydrogenase
MKSVVRDGRRLPRTEDVPLPAARPGHVLVRTCVSLVSGGTERAVAEFAGLSLAAKAARRPDLVRQVVEKVRRDGVWEAQRAVRTRLSVAESLGYSCSGLVEEDGTGEHAAGSLVACAGGGHAAHAEFNLVPRNLVAGVPPGVSAEQAAFATVGSVALHGVRLTRGGLGDAVAVVGLGLIGQLAVQLLRAAGCRVFGIDPDPVRARLATEAGCERVATEPAALVRAVAEATRRRGVDAVLVAASTADAMPVDLATDLARGRGRIVVVGDTQLHLDRRRFYEKELRLVVSRAYGPGRYDRDYEERGVDYPYQYVRWTLQRNMEAFLGLVPQLRLDALVSHRFDIGDAARAYGLLVGEPREPHLGILLCYPHATPAPSATVALETPGERPPVAEGALGVSLVGAGAYARATLLPALAKVPGIRRVAVVSARGLSAWDAGRQFGFERCSGDLGDAVADDTGLVVVATRHSQHAPLVRRMLGEGKAVFVEKPLCVSEEELDAIVADHARAPRPFLMVGYNRRFAPLVARLRACLAGVGRPLVLSYRVNAGTLPEGSWLLDAAEGGGRLVGEACHFVDLLMHLADAPLRRVHAVRPSVAGRAPDTETFTALLEFTNGAAATLVYSADGDAAHPKERLEVIGGGAVAVLDDFRALTFTHRGRRRRFRTWGRDKGHLAELHATVDAVRAGAPPPIPFAEIEAGMRATFAIRTALATGEPVELT